MNLTNRTVLVSGIGGNVGQGVLRCLRADFPELKLVGIDTHEFTAGHHFCDLAFRVPESFNPAYPPIVSKIMRENGVELAIPCTDYETHFFPRSEGGAKVLAVSSATAEIFLDKYVSSVRFASAKIPFAESLLPSVYDGRWPETMIKPRKGKGSRDLHVNPKDPRSFDDSYIVQPLLKGTEITAAFYARRDGTLHGLIVFERELQNGMTERCSVAMQYAAALKDIASKMISEFEIRGPCNIQAKVLEDGSIVPFEINCRYSGTTSIRSQLGFRDVRYGIQEYLLDSDPEPVQVVNGSAIRIAMDIIYPRTSLSGAKTGNSDSFVF